MESIVVRFFPDGINVIVDPKVPSIDLMVVVRGVIEGVGINRSCSCPRTVSFYPSRHWPGISPTGLYAIAVIHLSCANGIVWIGFVKSCSISKCFIDPS